MLLALDIGNSAVKGGLFDDTELVHVFTVSTNEEGLPASDADAWTRALRPHLRAVSIQQIGLASVVPSTARALTEALERLTQAPTARIRPSMPLPFTMTYETPDTLGADRLAAAAAGWVQYGRSASPPQSILVVDAGTAVTCEVIHRDGIYQGGVIGAGPALIRNALRRDTAQLPDVPLSLPEDPVGQSTQSALQSGIMWGLVDGVRGMLSRLSTSLPDPPRIILTGGWSSLLAPHLDRVDHTAPHLVLEGIRILRTGAVD